MCMDALLLLSYPLEGVDIDYFCLYASILLFVCVIECECVIPLTLLFNFTLNSFFWFDNGRGLATTLIRNRQQNIKMDYFRINRFRFISHFILDYI